MKKFKFTKMAASGNDFVVVEKNCSLPAKQICDRKYGAGADGLLVLEKSEKADVRMRIFNADGSEAEMCGNGARCAALYAVRYMLHAKNEVTFETKAGIIKSEVDKNTVRIKLTGAKNLKLDIPIRVNNRPLRVNFINTGVPHTVIFVEGLDKINVVDLGNQIRFHQKFAPAGTNVDFVEVMNRNSIKVRTYERGVEDETLACGTGSVASALVYAIRYPLNAKLVNVITAGGEALKVSFDKTGNEFKNIWLEGKVKIVYRGEYYV